MNRYYLIMAFSFVWLCAEIALARYRRAKAKSAAGHDKSSIRWLWIVIITAVTIGVFTGVRGFGLIRPLYYVAPVLGLTLIIVGSVVRWIAIRTLGKFFTVKVTIFDNHRLIDKGIYGRIRHPAYSGSLLSFFGLGLFFSSWITLPVIFLPILSAFLYRIKIEERALREKFGQAYIDYAGRTVRLIPGLY